jgi:hypothetical protein
VTGTLDGEEIDRLDPYVTAVVVERLVRPDGPALQAPDDEDALAARAEAAQLTARLEEWRESGRRGETSSASLARIEGGLLADIQGGSSACRAGSVPRPGGIGGRC